jgi:hypothetical protein
MIPILTPAPWLGRPVDQALVAAAVVADVAVATG